MSMFPSGKGMGRADSSWEVRGLLVDVTAERVGTRTRTSRHNDSLNKWSS